MTKKGKKNYKIHLTIYSILFLLLIINIAIVIVHKEAVSSFKRLYNNYSKTLQLTVNQMGNETGCYFSTSKTMQNDFSGCDKFFKEFATNLRVTKYCKDNSLKNGCIPEYKNYIDTPQCQGFSKNMMNNFDQTFVIGETSTITIYNHPIDVQKPIMLIDSNGKFPPNRSGYDQFSLVIMRNQNGDYYFHSNITYC